MKKYIFGNWKLNKNQAEVSTFFATFNKQQVKSDYLVYGVAPTFLGLQLANYLKQGQTNIVAQDVCEYEHGSFTGQISVRQLNDLNINYVIVGHSEARKYLGCTDQIVNKKVAICLANDITPIICIGESLKEYKAKQTKKVLAKQLKTIFKGISVSEAKKCIIAYEPLWAIGSGKTPSLSEINGLCTYLKQVLKTLYKQTMNTPILYGGSVNNDNAIEIATQLSVDGLLIGGASLDANKFATILQHLNLWLTRK
ncbi:MAG: triose-phosphate isomerase [Mycoplasmoidaceae bacterium]